MVLLVVFRQFGSVGNGTMTIGLDGQSLDHWRGAVWDPGIVGQQCLNVCYDCLCLMALFREVMLLLHNWAENGLSGVGPSPGIADQLPGN